MRYQQYACQAPGPVQLDAYKGLRVIKYGVVVPQIKREGSVGARFVRNHEN